MQQHLDYRSELLAKTRTVGLALSVIMLLSLLAMIYLDTVAPFRGIFWWRMVAVLAPSVFLFYGVFLFPHLKAFALPLHLLQLVALMVMVCGVSATLLTQPDFPAYARTALGTSLLACIFVDYAFAAGARRYLFGVLLAPLVGMSVYVIAAGLFGKAELLWLLVNPLLMAIILSTLALVQERANVRDFKTRQELRRAESERLELERRVAASERREELGILAGGVAHNFNNLLTIILGHAELLRETLPKDSPLALSIAEITKAGERSSQLVSRLLSFGKQPSLRLRPLNLNALVEGCCRTLREVLRENIALEWMPAGGQCFVEADAASIEQILLNLTLNAQDAIAKQGRIVIETAEVTLGSGPFARRHEDRPGSRYISLGFSDSGVGMSEETLSKVFTPFFTTKDQGKGTGLGLFTVYGLVKQHHGEIEVQSTPGAGTRVSIRLPRVEALSPEEVSATERPSLTGKETILLVEDEEPIRLLLAGQLRALGYSVTDASDGSTAMTLFAQCKPAVQLLVSDVVMPHMNGIELYERLREIDPALRVLYMTGYSNEVVSAHLTGGKPIDLVQKPLTGMGLASRMREVLDRKRT